MPPPPRAARRARARYLGFSVAYGHYLVRWADARVAYRFAGGPRPQGPPKFGRARAVHEWRMCGRTALAAVPAALLLECAVRLVGDADRTEALRQWQLRLAWVTGLNAAFAASYTLWPRREPATGPRR
ncbi:MULTISPECIES: hypothetical protein [unclassified Streptomyces]|uniref:hypothetical protein n=1 Tax=unclassified Streptomyces TaxID=2593676 RepID=UPI003823001F